MGRPRGPHPRVHAHESSRYGQQFAEYHREVTRSGTRRRTKAEIQVAAHFAMLVDTLPLLAWARDYPPVGAITTHAPQPRSAYLDAAKRELKAERAISVFTRHKGELIEQRTSTLLQAAQDEFELYQEVVLPTLQNFERLDWTTNLVVFQEVFAANRFPAVAIDLDVDQNPTTAELLVLMVYPAPEDVIWPEEFDLTAAGGLTVKRRGKADTRALYKQVLFCHLLACGKQALQSQPELTSARVIAVRDTNADRLGDLPVVGELRLDRDELDQCIAQGGWEDKWNEAFATWSTNQGNIPPDQALDFALLLADVNLQLTDEFRNLKPLMDHLQGKQTKRGDLSTDGTLSEAFPGEKIPLLEEQRSFDGLAMIAPEDTDLEFGGLDFWLVVADTVDLWRDSLDGSTQQTDDG